MREVLGDGRTPIVLLIALALACAVAERAAVCRLLAGLGLVLAGVLVNPWLINFVSSSITGALTFERVFWVLPVPATFGLFAAGTAALLGGRFGHRGATALAAAASIALLAAGTQRLVLSKTNGASVHFPPTLKTYPRVRKVASSACRAARPETSILASESVSRQVAMIHRCGPPVIAGMRWMNAPRTEERRRMRLQKYVSEKLDLKPEQVERFLAGLDRYHVSVVVMSPDAMANRALKAGLAAGGFPKSHAIAKYHLYVRAPRPPGTSRAPD
jgi:hypothetical protein